MADARILLLYGPEMMCGNSSLKKILTSSYDNIFVECKIIC